MFAIRRTTVALLLATAALLLTGCNATSQRMYPRSQMNTAWTVDYGAVTSIKDITIEGRGGPIGTYGGGFIGHEAGRTVGSGSGSAIASAAGAVVGAVAGRAIEKKSSERKGYEITVEIEAPNQSASGSTLAVVQVADEAFTVGQRVKVLRKPDGSARVTKV